MRQSLRSQQHDQDWLIRRLINPADFDQEFLLQPSFVLFLIVKSPQQPSPISEQPSRNLCLYQAMLRDHRVHYELRLAHDWRLRFFVYCLWSLFSPHHQPAFVQLPAGRCALFHFVFVRFQVCHRQPRSGCELHRLEFHFYQVFFQVHPSLLELLKCAH